MSSTVLCHDNHGSPFGESFGHQLTPCGTLYIHDRKQSHTLWLQNTRQVATLTHALLCSSMTGGLASGCGSVPPGNEGAMKTRNICPEVMGGCPCFRHPELEKGVDAVLRESQHNSSSKVTSSWSPGTAQELPYGLWV